MTRARFPLCLLLALAVLFPLSACGRHATVSTSPASSRSAPASAEPRRTPASDGELERYAEREKKASSLERFEGGRMSETATIVVVLLVVIIIILIV